MTGPSAIREQRERASVLKNEQKLREGEPQTFFARARAGLDDTDVPGGRYAAQQNHFPSDPSVGYPPAAGWNVWAKRMNWRRRSTIRFRPLIARWTAKPGPQPRFTLLSWLGSLLPQRHSRSLLERTPLRLRGLHLLC
jgi:hypothetical protein